MTGQSFPALHSLLDPDALLIKVRERYPLAAPSRCTLLRSYANDVYLVEGGEGRYALKIYRTDWRSAAAIRYEVALLDHLAARQIPVVTAIRQHDGLTLGMIQAPEGPRSYVLYTYAGGRKPVHPFTPTLYHRFGQATARMHAAADDFTSEHERTPLDLAHFLDRPLTALQPWFAHRRADWHDLEALAARVRDRIAHLVDSLDWGPCHGDLSLDNLHIDADGTIIFFDFDSGGPGWRASDPYGVYRYARQGDHRLWYAFLQGYRAIRRFDEADLAAVPYFAAAHSIERLGHLARNWVRWGGQWLLDDATLDRELAELRRWAATEMHG